MESIVVIGGGGHAKVLISLLKRTNAWNIIGYTDPCDRGELLGVSYLGTDERLETLAGEGAYRHAALGVGQTSPGGHRSAIAQRFESMGFLFPPVISTDAIVDASAIVRAGALIGPGAVVNAGATIGRFAIVNTGAIVEHDCALAEFVHVAPGAVLCGGVSIGAHAMVGAGATIIQYRTVAAGAMIGAGATVVSDCGVRGLYVGVPAALVRTL